MEWIISAASLVVAIIALCMSVKVSSQQLASNREMNELQKKVVSGILRTFDSD